MPRSQCLFRRSPRQRATAEVLGALDDKIAANSRQSGTTEELASRCTGWQQCELLASRWAMSHANPGRHAGACCGRVFGGRAILVSAEASGASHVDLETEDARSRTGGSDNESEAIPPGTSI